MKSDILELCKGVHCVDLGESFPTHIHLQNLASIQPRTSPLKFAASRGTGRCADESRWLYGELSSPVSDSDHSDGVALEELRRDPAGLNASLSPLPRTSSLLRYVTLFRCENASTSREAYMMFPPQDTCLHLKMHFRSIGSAQLLSCEC